MHKVPVADCCSEAKTLSHSILSDRVLGFLEQHVPHVAQHLFGKSRGLKDMRFFFTLGEPAINRYTEGGVFHLHRDGKSVTVNILLSDPRSFTGGGTLFWPEDSGDRCKPVLLQPRQCTGVL